MEAGCDDSMLHVPTWTAEVTMHMAGPFKDRLSDTGPAISFFWRPPGKNHHREFFLLWLLVLRENMRLIREKRWEKTFLASFPSHSCVPFYILQIIDMHALKSPGLSKHSPTVPT
jgi:hypothetical protein